MWTYKLHRTKDGATVTIPADVLRAWNRAHVELVRIEYHGGALLLTPYTRELRPVMPRELNAEEPPGGHTGS